LILLQLRQLFLFEFGQSLRQDPSFHIGFRLTCDIPAKSIQILTNCVEVILLDGNTTPQSKDSAQ
jgi:hypothetical protein